jgi:hypothetical protein
MKTGNIFLAALILTVLGASSCATFDRAATEQEEIITQIQKEQATSPVPEVPGTWVDANGWENQAMGDGD